MTDGGRLLSWNGLREHHQILGGLLCTDDIIDQGDEANPDGSNRYHAEDADDQG